MIAHQTQSPFYVQKFLRQKTMKATLRYVHLAEVLFGVFNDEYDSAVAETVDEARRLIEAGFDKHDEFNGIHIYRKRK